MSATGKFTTKRIYRQCRLCRKTAYPTDALLEFENRYTFGLRDLAVFAAVDNPLHVVSFVDTNDP